MSSWTIEPIESIDQQLIQHLLSNGEHERKILEFKRDLPRNSDSDKKEFLADVSSFANSSGGHIVYGIEEEEGGAARIHPIRTTNMDLEISRLENILRDGISPRLPSYCLHPIEIDSGGYVLVIRIVQSLISPHMVTFRNSSRFYSRNSNGKYQLDVNEIREAFLLSGRVSDEIREFRLERVSRAISRETPVTLDSDHIVLLHVVPLQSYLSPYQFDYLKAPEIRKDLLPMYGPITATRFNLDGLLAFSRVRDSICNSYVQLFNNGNIEAANSDMLKHREELIPSVLLESEVIKLVSRIFPMYRKIGVSPPFYIFLTLLNVKGRRMALNSERSWSHGYRSMYDHPIDRSSLLLPEIRVEVADPESYSAILKPLFDSLWRSAGWPYSHNYDGDTGKWNVR